MSDVVSLILIFVLAYPVLFGLGDIVNFIFNCKESDKVRKDDIDG